ncbi:MAG: trypsin-like peptidase domain-containing protein, partial [Desulfobacterales bacterium]|nr:trypsin-like peptidase domain-containing protein [Desulfobacterales bacterium]
MNPSLFIFIILFTFLPSNALGRTNYLAQLQGDISQAIASIRPAVVSVKALKKNQQEKNAMLWYESIGSGFVVDSSGYILTNYHVVKDAQTIEVFFWHTPSFPIIASIVDSDPSLDLVLLKVNEETNFVIPRFSDSDSLEIGDWVLSIGSPFGYQHSVSFGIISDLNRQMQIGDVLYKDMIQTDAVINQGNSGGPLVNLQGQIVGVGTAIYAPNGTYSGIGFAIPIKRAIHFFSRVTGGKTLQVAAVTTKAKEPVNLNKKRPNDAIHQSFSDCLECHIITQKMVVSINAQMTHPVIGNCEACHIIVKDKVTKGPTTVAFKSPTLHHMRVQDQPLSLNLKLII